MTVQVSLGLRVAKRISGSVFGSEGKDCHGQVVVAVGQPDRPPTRTVIVTATLFSSSTLVDVDSVEA